MIDYALAASLLYSLLAVDEFARLCSTCRALQALSRSHAAFQAAALGSRILWLTQLLTQQQHVYQETRSECVATLRYSLRSHCLALLQMPSNRPRCGRDLERLVAIYDGIMRHASHVYEGSADWMVEFQSFSAPLWTRQNILRATTKLDRITLVWWVRLDWQRCYTLEQLLSDEAFAAFQRMIAASAARQ